MSKPILDSELVDLFCRNHLHKLIDCLHSNNKKTACQSSEYVYMAIRHIP